MSKFTEKFKEPVAFCDIDGDGVLGYGVNADYDITPARLMFKAYEPNIDKQIVEKRYVRMSLCHTPDGIKNKWMDCENKKGAKAIWYLDLERRNK